MLRRGATGWKAGEWHGESGATLYIVAAGMVMLLGASALAIDMVSLYLARAEAQRAADAAALAAARVFVDSGCTATGGCAANGPQESPARQAAENVGNQNTIAGQAVSVQDSDVVFNYSPPAGPEEPQVTVTVQRTAARGNAMPTFFAKVFGVTTVDVAAAATAEAFNPSGSNVPVGTSCMKPFLVASCDPDHTTPANTTGTCNGEAQFFDAAGNIANPGIYNPKNPSKGGVIGEPLQLHTQAAPSQWYELAFNGAQSKSAWETNVTSCAPVPMQCGDIIPTLDGKAVGPNDHAIDNLIHAPGQDTINTTSGPPFFITGGSSNPYGMAGKIFYSPSDSLVSVPVFSGLNTSGKPISPGKDSIKVVGKLQLFIQDIVHSGKDDIIDAVITNIGGCGTGPAGGTPITMAGGSPIPIRLIRTN
jgi:Putative Flp pilus-assembly TadE/G-like